MNDIERVIGELREAKKWQKNAHDELKKEMRAEFIELHKRIDDLYRWRWQITGASLIIAVIISRFL